MCSADPDVAKLEEQVEALQAVVEQQKGQSEVAESSFKTLEESFMRIAMTAAKTTAALMG